jgi:altered-inheritance-of-mitochondria protein 5
VALHRNDSRQNGLQFRLRESLKRLHCPLAWLIKRKAGGVTVTLGVAYLSVLAHERNRQSQAQALRSQSRVLNAILEPDPISPPRSRAELAREERSTFVEAAKDRWNEEVENAVRWVQRTDWNEVREGIEDSVSRLLGRGLQKSREGIEGVEKQAGPKVQEAIERSRETGRHSIDAAAVGIDRAASAAISGVEKAGVEAKDSARRVVASAKDQVQQTGAKAGAHDAAEAIRRSGGTVDAARSAVRGAISKGIEKGREALGISQDGVGLGEENLESKEQLSSLSSTSAVEKALQERYQRRPEKSVEDALAERYTPIDARDNTVSGVYNK